IVRNAVGGGPKTTLATDAGSTVSTIPRQGDAVSAVAHPPVVMIFFDEFPLRSLLKPDGTVNAALFPNFAWLSKNTTWFRKATGLGPTLKDSGAALGKIVSPFKDKSDPTTEFADSGSTAFTSADAATATSGSGSGTTTTTAADQPAAKCTSTECLFVNLGADQ